TSRKPRRPPAGDSPVGCTALVCSLRPCTAFTNDISLPVPWIRLQRQHGRSTLTDRSRTGRGSAQRHPLTGPTSPFSAPIDTVTRYRGDHRSTHPRGLG